MPSGVYSDTGSQGDYSSDNDSTGTSGWTSSDTQGSTTIEAGSRSTTDYGYIETGGQTSSETGSTDSLTGDSTLTDSINTNSSLHETGSEGPGDSYLMKICHQKRIDAGAPCRIFPAAFVQESRM